MEIQWRREQTAVHARQDVSARWRDKFRENVGLFAHSWLGDKSGVRDVGELRVRECRAFSETAGWSYMCPLETFAKPASRKIHSDGLFFSESDGPVRCD